MAMCSEVHALLCRVARLVRPPQLLMHYDALFLSVGIASFEPLLLSSHDCLHFDRVPALNQTKNPSHNSRHNLEILSQECDPYNVAKEISAGVATKLPSERPFRFLPREQKHERSYYFI